MKKSILLGLIMVFCTFLATSVSKAIDTDKADFKVVKTEISTIKSNLSSVNAPDLKPSFCYSIPDFDTGEESKVTKEDTKKKDFALPSEGIQLKHPKSIHFTRYSRYQDRLHYFSRQVYSNKILNSHIFNKVRFS